MALIKKLRKAVIIILRVFLSSNLFHFVTGIVNSNSCFFEKLVQVYVITFIILVRLCLVGYE